MDFGNIQESKTKDILKNVSWDDVKLRYSLQSKLAGIPRPILNRRYKKLQQVGIFA